MTDQDSLALLFEQHRPRLRRIAERMLGSASESDDAVQDVWLRASAAGVDDVQNIGGWLTTITSRACLNILRARAARGEIPLDDDGGDPVVEPEPRTPDPLTQAQREDAISAALTAVHERLSPAERVAFVLHDSFDVPFEQIAELLERSPEAVRQLASRARRRMRSADVAGTRPARERRPVVDAFFAAARAGDFDRLVALLSPEVELRIDQGLSATSLVRGSASVASRALMFAIPDAVLEPVLIDGLPGVVVLVGGRAVSVMAFDVDGDRIAAIDAFAGPARVAELTLPTR
ncbi:sigma-70 family RNA polymerase sigma factor [Microbacterium azadirachtae]|uniref:Putative ECF RNA polymerase sigma factor SigI n=1 Tax=Microbacterium azadirachtae TaxID=582680 RepID=A0A0F0KJL4_9MICO|nr:sigma-70 family RNA polymerase sigma factor [Microbacterium azadirachtae]KJL19456.1 putative ECF RNA polymerase sigma factor SigI [Microbacterium azadirachtae]SDL43105.1 RNA polymerase sigma-70 factor, ECF subfamily [Microbacterium azadirachtae]SEF73612.1 RNA polymerase sigma-70 factor, ECF subfamily [Microbacterium azadirachtae]SEF74252.1 RNA polymerase sigma-70 factor, ECF subfamily [Microbacterium azadirachtae]